MKRTMILLAAVLGALVLYVDLSGSNFRERVEFNRKKIRDKITSTGQQHAESLSAVRLPEPVRKYLQYVLGNSRPPQYTARIRQSGVFRVNETDTWIPFTADHYLHLKKPSFVWHGRMQPHPYVWTESQDTLLEGNAETEHRLYSAFLFQHYTGKTCDLSALVRYLTEAPWAPTAFYPSRHLEWKSVNERTARAILTFKGYQVSAEFTFNDVGEIVSATTNDRFFIRKGASEAVLWTAHYRRYEQHGGIRIPMEVNAEWSLRGKSVPYARMKVEEIIFDDI
jgi:hypothetical protein